MTTYEEAKRIALGLEPDCDYCTETTDAYLFYRKDGEPRDGGRGDCVILKETGKPVSMTVYYTGKMRTGEETVELRVFAIQ